MEGVGGVITAGLNIRIFWVTVVASSLFLTGGPALADEPDCRDRRAGEYQLYWGDLHVHTALSMDAYAFGNRRDPGDAFAYGRGQPLLLEDGRTLSRLDRPLDFMAVTDHAETFDVMYLCADPEYRDNAYCRGLRKGSRPETAVSVFRNYLLPVIAGDKPAAPPLCSEPGIDCADASRRQWRRSQEYANAANTPCEFTAFIGSEWSATPNHRHWHRNLIFATESVTHDVIDYVRYPDVGRLWEALEEQCRPEAGCDVIAIPHNTNLSESGNFAIESDSPGRRQQRIRYERLVEVHQSKGSSECLPENWDDDGADCGFERMLPRLVEQKLREGNYSQREWRELRSGYVRSVLSRGLQAYQQQGAGARNPLQLGLIGSTDNHSATPGDTAEQGWKGDVWAWGDDPAGRLQRLNYNPGGLVAVWAEQNTRRDIFEALKARRAYGTSGTRIGLRFGADRKFNDGNCRRPLPGSIEARMGETLDTRNRDNPVFLVQAAMDRTPLTRIEIIKGSVVDGEVREQVSQIFDDDAGSSEACVTWTDEAFSPDQPAYWYVRVLELPTPRWSRLDCRMLGNCAEIPGADIAIQERAWSSPIWYLPDY